MDNLDKASALSTDQIDIENAERYGITYVNEKGERSHPMILHCSPSGAIERCVYAMLEKAYRDQQKGKVAILPLWLSPIQVRVISVSDSFIEDAEKIAEEIERHRVRVDLDDRPMTIQKKVREAETEWINYVLVIGQKEIESGTLSVRDRNIRKIRKIRLQEFIDEVNKKTEGMPFKPLMLPRRLSERPRFFG